MFVITRGYISHIIRLGIGGPNLHIGMAFEDIERDVRVEHRRVHFTRLGRCGHKWQPTLLAPRNIFAHFEHTKS